MQVKNEMNEILAESFRELARKRPVEKITVKEITDKAGVIRPTFYNHFQDKFELVEWMIQMDLLEPIRPLIRNGMTTEAMVLLFSNIKREKEFYTRVVKLEGPVTFHDIAQKCVKEFLLEIYTEEAEGKQSKHKWLTREEMGITRNIFSDMSVILYKLHKVYITAIHKKRIESFQIQFFFLYFHL